MKANEIRAGAPMLPIVLCQSQLVTALAWGLLVVRPTAEATLRAEDWSLRIRNPRRSIDAIGKIARSREDETGTLGWLEACRGSSPGRSEHMNLLRI